MVGVKECVVGMGDSDESDKMVGVGDCLFGGCSFAVREGVVVWGLDGGIHWFDTKKLAVRVR